MAKKSVTSLDQVDTSELDAAMNGKKSKPSKSVKAAEWAESRKKGKKAVPAKAEPKSKAPFRVHAMAYNDKTSTYGKCANEEFESLAEVLAFVEAQIEKGQGDGLHEVAIHVR